jgi:hypothetical protein
MTALTINELRQEFRHEMTKLPPWIIGTKPLHHMIWQAMDVLNETLIQLIINKVLSQRVINRIIAEFDDVIVSIVDNVEEEFQIRIAIYYTTMVEYLELRTLQEEQYEACSNLKKFSDYYFKNTQPTP